jgi:uncharacterized protein with PQ loop repeat
MNELITTLYIGNAAIATIAYAPQCFTLWQMLKTDNVNTSVSLATWVLWSWACGVTALYAFTVNTSDWAFKTISVINAVFCVVTLVLTALVHSRYNKKSRSKSHEPA